VSLSVKDGYEMCSNGNFRKRTGMGRKGTPRKAIRKGKVVRERAGWERVRRKRVGKER
jgi:hypothetical protein